MSSHMICPTYNLFFETIAHKLRMKILFALRTSPMSVQELVNFLDEEQSKVSHNLRKLKQCKFVDVKKEGEKRIYSLNKKTVVPLLNIVEKHVQQFCCEECSRKLK